MNTIKSIFAILLSAFLFCSCKQKTVQNPSLSGPWLVTVTMPDIGRVQTVMTFDVHDTNANAPFDACSPKNVDRMVLGFWKSTLAHLFSHSFKHGSIMNIENGMLFNNDSIAGVLNTPFGNYTLHTKITNGAFSGSLYSSGGAVAGTVSATKGQPRLPLHNYTALMQTIIDTTKDKLYDPALLNSVGWKNFTNKMLHISNKATDDATFVLAFFYYAHKFLPFSHFNAYHPADNTDTASVQTGSFVSLKAERPGVEYMRITSFGGSASEMDSVFQQIENQNCDTLIVDLRNNPGGSVQAGMAFARHVVPDTLYGGIFLTRKYFSSHTAAPNVNEYKSFPWFSEANYDLLMNGISTYSGICLKVNPLSPVFKKKIFVLTNGNTASTCEPIVYALKQYKIATIVGEPTAGAMLNGEHFTVADGFVLTVPTATYYTADGYKIDQHGVMPNIKIKAEDALNYVLTGKKPAR